MLKIIGVSLISCAVALMGFVYAANIKKRLQAVDCAIKAVMLLKTAVTLRLLPLDAACAQLAVQNELLNRIQGKPSEEREKILRQMGLGKEEIVILQALLRDIPRAAAGSSEHFDAALEQLNIRFKMQKEAAEQAAALYPKLGLLCGAAVFLLLI